MDWELCSYISAMKEISFILDNFIWRNISFEKKNDLFLYLQFWNDAFESFFQLVKGVFWSDPVRILLEIILCLCYVIKLCNDLE